MIEPLLASKLASRRRRWLVTGVAGFIGSHIADVLLQHDQDVVGMDDFSTGFHSNSSRLSLDYPTNFRMFEGDIRSFSDVAEAIEGCEIVLHQAALGSVPRSLSDPLTSSDVNIKGFQTVQEASRLNGVRRFVFAASSSTYGDSPALPKQESIIGAPLSPYAATKLTNEILADVYARSYSLDYIGLRYFNVFGPRQDPSGAYAAVIPRWIHALQSGNPIFVNGDGSTTRDFCFIANAVQANIRAALVEAPEAINQIYNVAVGAETSLLDLIEILRGLFEDQGHVATSRVEHRDFRPGDVHRSLADISKARRLLGYKPSHTVGEGLRETVSWFLRHQEA